MALKNWMDMQRQQMAKFDPRQELAMQEENPLAAMGQPAPTLEQLAEMQPQYAAEEGQILAAEPPTPMAPAAKPMDPGTMAGIQAGTQLLGGLMKSATEGRARAAAAQQKALQEQSQAEQGAISQAEQSRQNALSRLIASYKSALF